VHGDIHEGDSIIVKLFFKIIYIYIYIYIYFKVEKSDQNVGRCMRSDMLDVDLSIQGHSPASSSGILVNSMIVLSSCGLILAKRKPHYETRQIKTRYHFQTHKVTVNPRSLAFSLRSLFHYARTHPSLFYNACRALYVYKIMNTNLLGIISFRH
jgi:hypothetical protein